MWNSKSILVWKCCERINTPKIKCKEKYNNKNGGKKTDEVTLTFEQ